MFVLATRFDLLEAVISEIDEEKNIYISDGYDGFPAFGFQPGSELKQPYRMYLPEKLPAEFTLEATFKPMSNKNSYLFAVLNPFETVVQLGIRIAVIIFCLCQKVYHLFSTIFKKYYPSYM